jgi:hypothetical protein
MCEAALLLVTVLRSEPDGASGISISASAGLQGLLLLVEAVVGRVMAVAS